MTPTYMIKILKKVVRKIVPYLVQYNKIFIYIFQTLSINLTMKFAIN